MKVKVLDCERLNKTNRSQWVVELSISGDIYYPTVEVENTKLELDFFTLKVFDPEKQDLIWETVRDYLVDNGIICMGEDGDYYDLNTRYYCIYQLPLSNKNIFRSQNFEPKSDDYVATYCDSVSELKVKYEDDIQICEVLFQKFNCHHPRNFAGHSLSCSDVVVITYGEGETWVRKAYLCVAHGFEDVTKSFFGDDE